MPRAASWPAGARRCAAGSCACRCRRQRRAEFLNAHVIDYSSRNDGVGRLHLTGLNGQDGSGEPEVAEEPAGPVAPRVRGPVDPADQIIYTGMEKAAPDPA